MNSVVNQTVAVVDYGMGNLRSVAQAVIHATTDTHVNAVITQDPQVVRKAHRVVLPGQGAMADCMRELRESGLLESVLEAAATKPLFGVCVGMQMLLDHSAEGHTAAGTPGLGLIAGEVLKFDCAGQTAPDGSRFKVPLLLRFMDSQDSYWHPNPEELPLIQAWAMSSKQSQPVQ